MAEEETKYSQDVIDAYDRMVDAYRSIKINRITILTGNNGSGKSLIRKQMPFIIDKHYDLNDIKKAQRKYMSTSMDARTGSRPDLGGLSGMMRDTEWVATSQDTYSNIEGIFKAVKGDDNVRYLVIDEFEIGCGEETTLALTLFINEKMKELKDADLIDGALIITHSRIGVKDLICDDFVNIEGMTKEEWLNREIVPTDLVKLDKNELFCYIRDNPKK